MFSPTVPLIILLDIQPLTLKSAMVSWNTSNSLVDNYTVSYTNSCDNIKETVLIVNGTSDSTVIDSLYPGLQYSISITAVNVLGKGMERNDSVTLEGNGKYNVTLITSNFLNYFSRPSYWSSSVTISCIDQFNCCQNILGRSKLYSK